MKVTITMSLVAAMSPVNFSMVVDVDPDSLYEGTLEHFCEKLAKNLGAHYVSHTADRPPVAKPEEDRSYMMVMDAAEPLEVQPFLEVHQMGRIKRVKEFPTDPKHGDRVIIERTNGNNYSYADIHEYDASGCDASGWVFIRPARRYE